MSNRTNQPVAAVCDFRVAGRLPELWHPVSGERRTLSDFSVTAGRTSVPLRFSPEESYFLVFRQPGNPGRDPAKNFTDRREVLALTGSWEVSFDPKWGGPEKTTFEKLVDWKDSAEAGIKYYSGRAIYRQSFDLPGNLEPKPGGPDFFLDLGTVRNLARVRLNGKDLGVVWCAPWEVKANGALRAGRNDLEITVANLWVNRLIGDAGLPAAQRLTWTTENPLKPDSVMESSGLLGPVALLRAETAGAR